MRILAPFNSAEEVESLIKAGAEELYCGYYDEYWYKKKAYPNIAPGFHANLNSFEELEKSIKIAKRYNVPVYLCDNIQLSKGLQKHLIKEISEAVQLGISGIIIVDLSLIPAIKKLSKDCTVILSSKEPCFNSEQARFFKSHGIERIFLPLRNMNLNEVKMLLDEVCKLQLGVEIFINDIGCRNITSMCQYRCLRMPKFYKNILEHSLYLGYHVLEGIFKRFPVRVRNRFGEYVPPWELRTYPCHNKFKANIFKYTEDGIVNERNIKDFTPKRYYPQVYCGLCSVYLLRNYKLGSIKLMGRGCPTKKKVEDIKFTKKYLGDIKSHTITDDNYILRGKELYRQYFGKNCRRSQCYHI